MIVKIIAITVIVVLIIWGICICMYKDTPIDWDDEDDDDYDDWGPDCHPVDWDDDDDDID